MTLFGIFAWILAFLPPASAPAAPPAPAAVVAVHPATPAPAVAVRVRPTTPHQAPPAPAPALVAPVPAPVVVQEQGDAESIGRAITCPDGSTAYMDADGGVDC